MIFVFFIIVLYFILFLHIIFLFIFFLCSCICNINCIFFSFYYNLCFYYFNLDLCIIFVFFFNFLFYYSSTLNSFNFFIILFCRLPAIYLLTDSSASLYSAIFQFSLAAAFIIEARFLRVWRRNIKIFGNAFFILIFYGVCKLLR